MSAISRRFATAAWATLALLPSALSHADEKADALLKEVEKATKAIKSLSGEITNSTTFGGKTTTEKLTFRMKRPNYVRLESTVSGRGGQVVASNGKDFFIYMPQQNQYMKMKADPQGKNIGASFLTMLMFNFNLQSVGGNKPKYEGAEKIGGTTYQVVSMAAGEGQNFRLYISPAKLATRFKVEVNQNNQKFSQEEVLSNLKLNPVFSNASFAYTPPRTAKLYEQPSSNYDAKLLPVQSRAPEFNVATPEGERLALATTLKEKKAVLINFWFYS